MYRLPSTFLRPIARTDAERRRDAAIEMVIASRMENHGESLKRAFERLFGIGPEFASFGALRPIEVARTIRRDPQAVLDRAESAWCGAWPEVLNIARISKDGPSYWRQLYPRGPLSMKPRDEDQGGSAPACGLPGSYRLRAKAG